MIDELFLVGSHFLFLQQQQYIVLVTPPLWWHMWSAVLTVEREGRGGGVLCANNKISTPRYSPLEKPAHPTDRPTGTMKQLFFWGGGFFFLFFACALRLSSRSNRSSRITTKMSPYFVLFDATIIVYYY